MPLLEICCYSYQSAVYAAQNGAERVELCAGYGTGGLTPLPEVVEEVRKLPNLNLYVMIRPRAGDFCYSEEEFEQMKTDIRMASNARADGVVFGILNPDKTIDLERNTALAALAKPMDITFHKAFDETPDLFKALDDIYSCGITRVLTSGGKANALEGILSIRKLVAHRKGLVKILAGGGIRSSNILNLRIPRLEEFHSSAIPDAVSGPDASPEEIRNLKMLIDSETNA